MDRAASIALLEAHHVFPSDHVFRVIVAADEAHVAAVLASVAAFRGVPDVRDRVVEVPSAAGRWRSLRITLTCATAADVVDLYAHVGTLPQVVKYL